MVAMEPADNNQGVVQKLSPRARMALRAYATGAATQKEAAESAGLHPAYGTQLANSAAGQAYIKELSEQLDQRSLDLTAVLEKLSQKALIRMAQFMESGSDAIAFKATQDLLDRGPRTTKVQKVQTESFILNGQDAKALAEAMVAGAGLSSQFPEAATGNFVKVPDALAVGRSDSEPPG